MHNFDFILILCGALVIIEAAAIITLNTKRGYWESTNILHMLSSFFYLIYLTVVIYSSMEITRSNQYCDLLWRICSTLYMTVTMCVYSFYWARSRLVNRIEWRGRKIFERIVIISIALMVANLCFFWYPNKSVQYNGFLMDGECYVEKRPWIGALWVSGDAMVSLLLLLLYVRPLMDIDKMWGDPSKSITSLDRMRQMTTRDRNLLTFTVLFTLGVITAALAGNLKMQYVIYLCAIDRLVTLQCITMTFSYDQRNWFYCYSCFLLCHGRKEERKEEIVYNHEASVETIPSHNKSSNIINTPAQSHPKKDKNSNSELIIIRLAKNRQ